MNIVMVCYLAYEQLKIDLASCVMQGENRLEQRSNERNPSFCCENENIIIKNNCVQNKNKAIYKCLETLEIQKEIKRKIEN